MKKEREENLVLVINPGSTSTKVAVFGNHQLVAEMKLNHSISDLSQYKKVPDQKMLRKSAIMSFLEEEHISCEHIIAVVGRGGLLKPIPGGTYEVSADMINDLTEEKYNTHASNLGAVLAKEFADQFHVKAYIVDPVVVDELEPLARISGLKGIDRRSVSHVLNQKAVAREVLKELGKTYATGCAVVAHIGGGVSIGAHKFGKIIDVNNGLDGEGPFSPERTGGLPLIEFAEKIIRENMNLDDVKKLIAGQGGLKSYLNEIDLRILEQQAEAGNEEVKYYLDGMCYQIKKQIGEMAVVLNGELDAIILTGGVAYSDYITGQLKRDLAWIAPVILKPGEMEMKALYDGVMRVLEHEEEAKVYESEYQRA